MNAGASIAVLVSSLAAAGCTAKPALPAAAPAHPGVVRASERDRERESSPSAPSPAETTLEVPGYDAATVSFPKSPDGGRLLVIATHGAGDTPDGQCDAWREALGDRGTILCPAGPRVAMHSEGRYYPDHFALERIVTASLAAFRKAHPEVGKAMTVYAGYSQGATMGALMIVAHGDDCPRLALVEGGFDGWTRARAEQFKRGGGSRVLFVCGTAHCRKRAEDSAATLRRTGVEARAVSDVSASHTYGGAVAKLLRESLPWLLE